MLVSGYICGDIWLSPAGGGAGVESQGLALDPDRGVESLSVPAADQGGIDSYVKLLLHGDGSDQGTSFTDSETTPKTVTNTETYDSYTKLMLHTDGSGGSTTFTDEIGKAVTANGNAQIDTAQKKFGAARDCLTAQGIILPLPIAMIGVLEAAILQLISG